MPPRGRSQKKPTVKAATPTCNCPAEIKAKKLKLAQQRKKLDYEAEEFRLVKAEWDVVGEPAFIKKQRNLETENRELRKEVSDLQRERDRLRKKLAELKSPPEEQESATATIMTHGSGDTERISTGESSGSSKKRKSYGDNEAISSDSSQGNHTSKRTKASTNNAAPAIQPNSTKSSFKRHPILPDVATNSSVIGQQALNPTQTAGPSPTRRLGAITIYQNIKNRRRGSESPSKAGIASPATLAAITSPFKPTMATTTTNVNNAPNKSSLASSSSAPSTTTPTATIPSTRPKRITFTARPTNVKTKQTSTSTSTSGPTKKTTFASKPTNAAKIKAVQAAKLAAQAQVETEKEAEEARATSAAGASAGADPVPVAEPPKRSIRERNQRKGPLTGPRLF